MSATTLERTMLHKGRVFALYREKVALENGVTIDLDIVRHPGAAAIAQDAYAEGRDTSVRLFNYLMDGILPPAKFLYTEMFVVTPETLDEFIASGQGA